MTRKALARRIAEPYLTSQQRREVPAPPQPEGLRGFWPGALLLVSHRPQRVFSFLAPRTQPKFAAALLYEPQTWCTSLRLPAFGFQLLNFASRPNTLVLGRCVSACRGH